MLGGRAAAPPLDPPMDHVQYQKMIEKSWQTWFKGNNGNWTTVDEDWTPLSNLMNKDFHNNKQTYKICTFIEYKTNSYQTHVLDFSLHWNFNKQFFISVTTHSVFTSRSCRPHGTYLWLSRSQLSFWKLAFNR